MDWTTITCLHCGMGNSKRVTTTVVDGVSVKSVANTTCLFCKFRYGGAVPIHESATLSSQAEGQGEEE